MAVTLTSIRLDTDLADEAVNRPLSRRASHREQPDGL